MARGRTVPRERARGSGDRLHRSATSTNRNGDDIGSASAPGPGATADNPLLVDSRGSISYLANTDAVFAQGTWNVQVYGLTGFSGSFDNSDAKTTVQGVARLEKCLDIGFGVVVTGLYHVHFTATSSDGATCVADGYVKLVDSPLVTPFFYFALLLLLLAFLLFFLGMPEPLLDLLAGDYDGAVVDSGLAPGGGP